MDKMFELDYETRSFKPTVEDITKQTKSYLMVNLVVVNSACLLAEKVVLVLLMAVSV